MGKDKSGERGSRMDILVRRHPRRTFLSVGTQDGHSCPSAPKTDKNVHPTPPLALTLKVGKPGNNNRPVVRPVGHGYDGSEETGVHNKEVHSKNYHLRSRASRGIYSGCGYKFCQAGPACSNTNGKGNSRLGEQVRRSGSNRHTAAGEAGAGGAGCIGRGQELRRRQG
jgi:hypothetical protein